MTRIALIAGTYQPERCGVAHYTERLRDTLSEQGIQSVVLTTHAAATNDPSVKGVVQNWRLADLLPLVQAVHDSSADILISNTLPLLTGLNVLFSCCRYF